MTKPINIMNLEVGMIVHFHGARFEVTSVEVKTHSSNGSMNIRPEVREDRVMVAHAKWLSGNIVNGYFGPEKDWTFQGNYWVSYMVEN